MYIVHLKNKTILEVPLECKITVTAQGRTVSYETDQANEMALIEEMYNGGYITFRDTKENKVLEVNGSEIAAIHKQEK